ncbi:MliC family protein [Stenotrophomonas sp. GZD-301]|uniref:MliC family protein n=1 Tax=Stenotrophomonas sp. GZD-301 TaxID=3404814 RepID=UPI003BB73CF4
MRASQGLLSVAIVLGLAACQPAQQPPADAVDPAAGNTDAPPATAATTDARTYAFRCGDLAVRATYRGDDAATVVAGERTFAMSSQPAASGAKYGDGEGNVFWTKGATEGILTLKGEADRSCTGAGEEGATVPPPAAAAGTAFRATGNEPGWLAVVADGATPHLRVETDYGQRTFEIATPTQGKDGWSGKAADGTDIKLTFQRTVCQDDMSGQAFGATAMLTVGARQYHGCGDFAGAPALAARP